ncbi:GAF and ANTAR domain-containing protein [Amycolatopsis carbonis]|uniref:GAF and ANTAR domain-containing protein n=1 Tax=Amycolatopsis carbonis TaxID=715471 RepID=A0A9Y2INW3_9PSEU|nr:GAF and ANTAR domain-containing protein [Amycolatopsis sp. 2-15]WIX82804.1 GAF and ANTAR domain-containing protein [Amycolatopsis sp. 2-15]
MSEQPHTVRTIAGSTGRHGRDQRLADTFVALADTLVDEFDALEFLHMLCDQCVELLEVSAAGVILLDGHGGLRTAAASSERAQVLEVFAVQTDDGPCIDCVRSGVPVASADLTADAARWPRFAAAAHECGFQAVQAVPMRLRGQVVGVLTLLKADRNGIDETSTRLGQALADVATIGMLQQRAIENADLLSEQLQTALNSRIIIEQAKGVLSIRGEGLDMESAFAALRGYARSHNQRLSELARAVAEGTADFSAILAHRTQPQKPVRHHGPR